MDLDFKDPVQPFKEAFSKLLAPKVLVDADPRDQTLRYSLDGRVLDISTLSSGEKEVVNIVFRFCIEKPI